MKMETIILTGIIFSSFLGSVISLMIALTGEELRQIIGWLLGSVSMRGWSFVTNGFTVCHYRYVIIMDKQKRVKCDAVWGRTCKAFRGQCEKTQNDDFNRWFYAYWYGGCCIGNDWICRTRCSAYDKAYYLVRIIVMYYHLAL